MNICIISSTFLPEFNGVSIGLHDRILQFAKMGHKVYLLCPDYSVESEIFPQYAEFQGQLSENVFIKPLPTQRNPLKADKPEIKHWNQWNLEEYIEPFQPDIIDVEDPDRIFGLDLFGMSRQESYGKCIGVEYAREKSIPVVAFYHTNYPAFASQIVPPQVPTPYRKNGPAVYQEIYGPYDLIFCLCRDARDYLKSHGLEKVKCGEFAGIKDEIYGTAERKPSIEEDGRVKIFYGGRFDGGKDITVVLEIFEEVHRRRPDTVLYLAGKGRDLDKVLEASSRNPWVKYLGYVEQKELAGIYDSADIYFSPHKTDTLGLSILEAMSRYLPVVAADEGGPRDIVSNGGSGFLCSTREEFIRAILKLAGDKGLREVFGNNGRKYAERYFSSNCARNLLDQYQALIEEGDGE